MQHGVRSGNWKPSGKWKEFKKFIKNYSAVFMPSHVGLEHLLSRHPLASSVPSHVTLCACAPLPGSIATSVVFLTPYPMPCRPLLYTLYPLHWEHSLALVTFYLVGVLDQAAPRAEILLSHL